MAVQSRNFLAFPLYTSVRHAGMLTSAVVSTSWSVVKVSPSLLIALTYRFVCIMRNALTTNSQAVGFSGVLHSRKAVPRDRVRIGG